MTFTAIVKLCTYFHATYIQNGPTPPHLKYAATLPCNLSLMACFADVNVSQGSVATYAKCGGIFWYPFNCKFTWECFSKKFCKSVKIWQNYGHESVVPFFGPHCVVCTACRLWLQPFRQWSYDACVFRKTSPCGTEMKWAESAADWDWPVRNQNIGCRGTGSLLATIASISTVPYRRLPAPAGYWLCCGSLAEIYLEWHGYIGGGSPTGMSTVPG